MDGFETLTAIRSDQELSHIPVIMCTGVSEREEVMRILQQGVAGYIMKPIETENLLSKIQKVLGAVDNINNQGDSEEITKKTMDGYWALIADENENFREIARTVLAPYYNIMEAKDERSLKSLTREKQPQIILLGKLADVLDYEDFLSKSGSIIQQKKIRVYRVYSTAIEAVAEQELKYHGRMILTLDEDLLRSRLNEMMVLPDFTISFQQSVAVVALKNCYPRTNEENRMLLQALAVVLDSDQKTIRLDLSGWTSESMAMDIFETASCYLEDIIKNFKSLDIKIEVIGYTPPEDSSLAALLTDDIAESRQKYVDYLTSEIDKLREYHKSENTESTIPLGQKLQVFGREHGFPQISLLAEMLVRESNDKNWDAVRALVEQLSREEKKIEENSI